MTLIVQMGALLVQGVAAAETTVVRPSGPAWYTIFTAITGAVTSVVFLVLLFLLIPAVARFRKTAAKFELVLEHIERSIDPVTKHASRIADNVDYLTTAVRADVQELRRTLNMANTGIREVIEGSERRLHELGAVLRVVQEETEHAFVSTVSTLRGVQAGAAALRDDGRQLASDELEVDEELDVDIELDSVDELEAPDDEFDEDMDADMDADLDEDLDADSDAARDAAEDMTDGYDNGSAFGRTEPRIKRSRRDDPA
jgi:uncharacterized protein YoxC